MVPPQESVVFIGADRIRAALVSKQAPATSPARPPTKLKKEEKGMRLMTILLALALAGAANAQTTTVTRETTEVRAHGPGAARLMELPTDTLVRIRMLDTIDSKNW